MAEVSKSLKQQDTNQGDQSLAFTSNSLLKICWGFPKLLSNLIVLVVIYKADLMDIYCFKAELD